MPKKSRKKKQSLEQYDLSDVFMEEASDGVKVAFEMKDPGHALICRTYLGSGAHDILAMLDGWFEGAAKEWGWDDARRREQVEIRARKAYGIYLRQLADKLCEAVQELKHEAIAQALREADYAEMSGVDFIGYALAAGDGRKKLRMGAPSAGRAPTWTRDTRAAFLQRYEELLREIKGAKKIYVTARGDKGWRGKAKRSHPRIPDSVIDKIPSRAYKPSDLAREAAAAELGFPASEYLVKVLAEARREATALPWGYGPGNDGLED